MNKKISVITGGGGGIGQAIARELGQNTALILVGRDEDNLKRAQNELYSQGMDVNIKALDISIRSEVEELAVYAESLGEVLNVINTAGVDPSNAGTADAIISTNAVGTINMVRAFYPKITEGGVFICFASLVAHHGPGEIDKMLASWGDTPAIYEQWDSDSFGEQLCEAVRQTVGGGSNEEIAGPAYAATKKFVAYFTKMNVARFALRSARIISVSPGLTITPMHLGFVHDEPEIAAEELATIPLKRKAQAFELGSLIKFLCSSGASFVNGVDILIDGGQIANVKTPQIA